MGWSPQLGAGVFGLGQSRLDSFTNKAPLKLSKDTDHRIEHLPSGGAGIDLLGEADKINDDDPKQAVNLMRKLSDMTGLKLGDGMDEALRRMEKGDDPEQVEAELGDILEEEDPFSLQAKKSKSIETKRKEPLRDETLYDL